MNACEDTLKKVAARLDEAREKARYLCLSVHSSIRIWHFHTDHIRSVSEEAGAHPEAVVQRHIKLLHQYNEIRDIGLGLLGMIAETRGDRLVDVQQQFGVTERD